MEVTQALLHAKTLHEKVKRFRTGTEVHTTVTSLYAIQTVVQVVASSIALGFNIYHYKNIVSMVNCCTDELIPVDHNFFRCFDALAPFYKMALGCFIFLLSVYCATCLYTCKWLVCRRSGTSIYTFSQTNITAPEIGNIPPAVKDLAFLLHLLDQCNKLFIDRFSVFLDETFEEKFQRDLRQLLWRRP